MNDPKEVAGRKAAELVRDGMRLGLGTGSTVHFALLRIAERMRSERLALRCVPTSVDTEKKALALGIPLVTLDDVETLDLTIDGADEIDGEFDMIKGGGGALLREKVVASVSSRVAIVVGRNKIVDRLGAAFPLPVEVVPFARASVLRALAGLGCDPVLRARSAAPNPADAPSPYHTDNGNLILDCRFPRGIDDPADLERRIDAIPGVVESGLFIGLAHVLVVGNDDGTCEVREKAR